MTQILKLKAPSYISPFNVSLPCPDISLVLLFVHELDFSHFAFQQCPDPIPQDFLVLFNATVMSVKTLIFSIDLGEILNSFFIPPSINFINHISSPFFFSFRQYLINFWVTLRLFLQSTYLCPKCLQFTFSNTVNLSVHSDNASPALAQQSLSSFKSSLLLNFSELMSAYFPFRGSALLAFAICFSPNAYQITLTIFSP